MMPWVILGLSGVCEAIWASALGASAGFTRPIPLVICAVAMVVSLLGLARAMRFIPTGTAYAVWTAIGSALTVIYAIVRGNEPVTVAKVVFLVGIMCCATGLSMTGRHESEQDAQ
ncbi:DMT family transporter [Trueperella sp. LYQ143]|uniref:DMT family transporter n=1 Tax=unclassified Trueperella TaxID=2630174 RepID=UPI0039834668